MSATNPSNYPPDLLDQLGIVNPDAVTTKQAAAYLSRIKGIPTATSSLEVYRCKGKGLRYRKIGSRVFYTLSDLDAYCDGIPIKIFDPAHNNMVGA